MRWSCLAAGLALALAFAGPSWAQDDDECFTCHGDASIDDMRSDPEGPSIFVDPDVYGESIHAEATCVGCHSAITELDYDADIPHSTDLTPVSCTDCHDDMPGPHRELPEESNAGKCSDCHGKHDIRYLDDPESSLSPANAPETCGRCHVGPSRAFAVSVHAEILAEDPEGGPSCVTCHGEHEASEAMSCTECHGDAMEDYATSVHGVLHDKGDGDVNGCSDCHGAHDVRRADDPLSKVHPTQLAETCGGCHRDPEMAKRHLLSVVDPSSGYLKGVHARAIREKGNLDAATCNGCHGNHDIRPSQDPESPVFHGNIPHTCGKCHPKITEVYDGSIHGRALAAGVKDAPTCIDCHGEHGIEPHDVDGSPVSDQLISRQTCPRCHENSEMMSKYGVENLLESSYMDSFHGMSSGAGSKVLANCTSCHGVHDIYPMDDPKSSVHPDNIVETCRKCHETANENFAAGRAHVNPTAKDQKILGFVRWIYLWLIGLTLGGMALHNLLFIGRHTLIKFRHERKNRPGAYKRFTLAQRLGHLSLLLSFVVLVLSGFALRFPEAWWVKAVFFGETGFELRGLIHRIAAIVMVVVTVVNMLYITLTKPGRKEFWALMITPQDMKDVFANLTFVVGLRKRPPHFDRYGYAEKAEYWGLMWGSIVMIVTGFAMWYAEAFMQYAPKIVLDVAALVHYYEAWLALGTIIIWHFYHVMFEPSVYPMNWSWVTGHVSEGELHHHHAIEWERHFGHHHHHEKKDDDA